MGSDGQGMVLGAIDVGTNAVRLVLARPLSDGAFERLHEERDGIRPGEGVFRTGEIPDEVADRLVATMRRYSALCRRFGARVRAVATSAVREARNGPKVVERVRREAGVALEVVSGKEEARLICLGVLRGAKKGARSLLVDIGGGSTEVAVASGEQPEELWSVALGAVRLSELFSSSGRVDDEKLELMRHYAGEALREAIAPAVHRRERTGLGSSGTIQAVVGYAAASGTAHATRAQITRAVERLAGMGPQQRRKHFDARRAEIILAGAVVLEAVMRHLNLGTITAVDRGLREGLLVDLVRRERPALGDASLSSAAISLGQWLRFDEAHARQVTRVALQLFDRMGRVHGLGAPARSLLEVAALLHDVGNVISHQRHHKHSAYILQHADLPGLADRERGLAALVARFHRRSAPERTHPQLQSLPVAEFQMVRSLSTLLRIADAFDRSHAQPVESIRLRVGESKVWVKADCRGPVDLESWDIDREKALFRRVFGRQLEVGFTPVNGRSRKR